MSALPDGGTLQGKLENKTFGRYKGLDFGVEGEGVVQFSSSQLYEMESEKVGCKANATIAGQLPKTPGRHTATDINASCNYIGDKGLLALLPVIRVSPGMTRIRLSDNGLRNDSVLQLLHVLLNDKKSVISLDLSGNKQLSLEVGSTCLKLVKSNKKFVQLLLAKTAVSKAMQENIETVLKRNRKEAGANNLKKLEGRVKIGKKDLFAAKSLFDKLDVDNSGTVSLHELCEASRGSKTLGVSGLSVFGEIDSDNDGEITLLEYLTKAFPPATQEDILFYIDCNSEFIYPEYVPPPELAAEHVSEIAEMFRLYDRSGDGRLSIEELKASMSKSSLCITDVDSYFKQVNKSGSGLLDLPEFIELMKPYYVG
ncbi:Calmodulin [Diplonema papillatum]|nr:Calmodulin [Diplonema papillatum]